jgi:hypothetical protein
VIIWRRLDLPGHEAATVSLVRNRWNLSGVALFAFEGQPCRLDYEIECDSAWSTRDARISGQMGELPVSLVISRSADGAWLANDAPQPDVQGCIDIDLGFTPSTNLLPIHRLKLGVGKSAEVRAAWVRFPELTIEVLEQKYTRLAEMTYLYESDGGRFRRELSVNADGFVTDYPGLWREERGE